MAQTRAPLIALLTDYGTAGWYVASMKGVILTICPEAQLVDITHEIPPQDIAAGAFTLARAAPWFPSKTIFACVVDPGVGTARPLIAAQADRQIFIGPDNGLLALVLQRAKRRRLVRLTRPRYWLPRVSRTFHGRDIIAPVAAHIARGCPLNRLGAATTRYQDLRLPPPHRTPSGLQGRVLFIDTFGNLITNIPSRWLWGAQACHIRYKRRRVRVVSSYMEGGAGELIALAGSGGYLELAVRDDSAVARYGAKRADGVELRWR